MTDVEMLEVEMPEKAPVFDSHIHFSCLRRYGEFERYRTRCNVGRHGIVSLPDRRRINFNPEALYAKAVAPGECYAFLGFDYGDVRTGGTMADEGLAEQVRACARLGADGLKLWTGKPHFQRQIGMDLRHPAFAAAFDQAAALGLPAVIHVADPPLFWHGSPSGLDHGLTADYREPGIPGFDELIDQAEEVVANHPRLRVVFPHLLFLAGDLPRLSRILDSHQNACVDLAPGLYFYGDLGGAPEAVEQAREFFRRYASRILFGTDGFWFDSRHPWLPQSDEDGNTERFRTLMTFLSSDERMENPFAPTRSAVPEIRGLGLDKDVLEAVLRRNADSLFGPKPRELEPDTIGSYLTGFAGRLDAEDRAPVLEIMGRFERGELARR